MGTTAPHPRRYLAEWYRPVVTTKSVDEVVAKLRASPTATGPEGAPVQLIVALAVPTDEVVYGLFAAHSSQDVVAACQHAGIPAQRLTADIDAWITRAKRV
jgi:hypothetical protein